MFEFVLQITGKGGDFRYVATSDWLDELNDNNFEADSDLELKLTSIIIQQLDDVDGDVSGLAVKWYYLLHKQLFLLLSVGYTVLPLIQFTIDCCHCCASSCYINVVGELYTKL